MDVLVDLHRLSLFHALSKKPQAFGELTFLTQLPPASLSSALRTYEKRGLVKIRKHFVGKRPQTMIELTKNGQEEWNWTVKIMQRNWAQTNFAEENEPSGNKK